MREFEPIEIVYTSNGRRDRKSFNWLLGIEAVWTMEVNPFIIQDADIKRKVENLTYNGQPVDVQLMAKYPKHGLDFYLRPPEPATPETTPQDYDEILNRGISEVKVMVDEDETIDIDTLIEHEQKGKNRTTLINYLHGIK